MKFRALLPITVIIPLLFLFLGSILARHFCYRDPTSLFFDTHHAYDDQYSDTRQREARKFIEASKNQTFLRRKGPSNIPLRFCIGIPTVSRRTTSDVYVDTAVGSILSGLNPRERDAIHLIPFIAHLDPSIHPIYRAPWIDNLQDVMRMENSTEINEKQILDYAYMLEACLKVNSLYIITFEDDILALDGWFHRTIAALRIVEEQVKLLGLDEWFYLRLFYTEQLLGWNSEFWLQYLLSSLSVTIAALSVVACYAARSKSLQRKKLLALGTTVFYCAVAIGFFFACGRVSMFPILHGVQQMPKYACCAQGLVLNRARVPRLIKWYRDVKLGYVDNRAEELADTGEVGTRWALTLSVIQHVGNYSSKGESEEGDSGTARHLRNFEYENNDPKVLDREHRGVLQTGGL